MAAPPFRDVTRRILERSGYRVLAAESGTAALEITRSLDRPPDLLLADVVMPGLNGYELARRLRDVSPSTRTLFMSGHTESRRARVGEPVPEAGEVLQKPFDASTLVRRIREALASADPAST